MSAAGPKDPTPRRSLSKPSRRRFDVDWPLLAVQREWRYLARTRQHDPPTPRPEKCLKLPDGKERLIQSMAITTFWSPDGKPMSAAQFVEKLFGELPALFKDEDELRQLCA